MLRLNVAKQSGVAGFFLPKAFPNKAVDDQACSRIIVVDGVQFGFHG